MCCQWYCSHISLLKTDQHRNAVHIQAEHLPYPNAFFNLSQISFFFLLHRLEKNHQPQQKCKTHTRGVYLKKKNTSKSQTTACSLTALTLYCLISIQTHVSRANERIKTHFLATRKKISELIFVFSFHQSTFFS